MDVVILTYSVQTNFVSRESYTIRTGFIDGEMDLANSLAHFLWLGFQIASQSSAPDGYLYWTLIRPRHTTWQSPPEEVE